MPDLLLNPSGKSDSPLSWALLFYWNPPLHKLHFWDFPSEQPVQRSRSFINNVWSQWRNFGHTALVWLTVRFWVCGAKWVIGRLWLRNLKGKVAGQSMSRRHSNFGGMSRSCIKEILIQRGRSRILKSTSKCELWSGVSLHPCTEDLYLL